MNPRVEKLMLIVAIGLAQAVLGLYMVAYSSALAGVMCVIGGAMAALAMWALITD